VAERAGASLMRRYDGLVIAGTHAGSPDPAHDEAILRRIEAAEPFDVLLVAYGAPGQETWMARNASRLRVPLVMGVGGTFNFLAGESRLPPRAVKRAGLIWLWRLATEPWRWRRQLALVAFAGAVFGESLRLRLRS
jgi:N-acetylglucosaminyldiphosphoundecaprenol N-acetyl-beta-D-mannosaminyltransferase